VREARTGSKKGFVFARSQRGPASSFESALVLARDDGIRIALLPGILQLRLTLLGVNRRVNGNVVRFVVDRKRLHCESLFRAICCDQDIHHSARGT
jgi:hypothetical protein